MRCESGNLAVWVGPNTSAMKWQSLLLVLPAVSKDTVLNALIEAIADVVPVDEIPDLFHELITVHLMALDSATRHNAAVIVQHLTSSFSEFFHDLMIKSLSDGNLATFESFVHSPLLTADPLLCGKPTAGGELEDIYRKSWLAKQKKAFHRILLSSANSAEAKLALTCPGIAEWDHNTGIEEILDSTNQSEAKDADIAADAPSFQQDGDGDTTAETWLARLTRFLASQLLSNQWEHREGAALGLHSIIVGLSISDGSYSNLLPQFLLQDITCIGITALVLDRVIEFQELATDPLLEDDEHDEIVLPVKGVLAVMVVRAVQALASSAANTKLVHIALDLMNHNENWTIPYAGLLIMKELLALDIGELLLLMNRFMSCLQQIAANCHRQPAELTALAANVLKVVFSRKRHDAQMEIDIGSFAEQLSEVSVDPTADKGVHLSMLSIYVLTLGASLQAVGNIYVAKKLFCRVNHCCELLVAQHAVRLHEHWRLLDDLALVVETIHSLPSVAKAFGDQLLALTMVLIRSSSVPSEADRSPLSEEEVERSYFETVNRFINQKMRWELKRLSYWLRLADILAKMLLAHCEAGELVNSLLTVLATPSQDATLCPTDCCRLLQWWTLQFWQKFVSSLAARERAIAVVLQHTLDSHLDKCVAGLQAGLAALNESIAPVAKKRRFRIVTNDASFNSTIANSDCDSSAASTSISQHCTALCNLLVLSELETGSNDHCSRFGSVQSVADSLSTLLAGQSTRNESAKHLSKLVCLLLQSCQAFYRKDLIELFGIALGHASFSVQLVDLFYPAAVHLLRKDGRICSERLLVLLDGTKASWFNTATYKQCRIFVSRVLLEDSHDIGRIVDDLLEFAAHCMNNQTGSNIMPTFLLVLNSWCQLTQSCGSSSIGLDLVPKMLDIIFAVITNPSLLDTAFHEDEVLANAIGIIECLSQLPASFSSNALSAFGEMTFHRLFVVGVVDQCSRILLANCCRQLVSQLSNSIVLHSFNAWISIGVHGMADHDPSVRRHSIQVFRCLVPLVPLAIQRVAFDNPIVSSSRTNTILQCFAAKQSKLSLLQSEATVDVNILLALRQHLSTVLRPYQWEGVSWWTFLRRCGLSGMLADEM